MVFGLVTRLPGLRDCPAIRRPARQPIGNGCSCFLALAQLMTSAIRDQCHHVATLAAEDNGLELAADWVEQMAIR